MSILINTNTKKRIYSYTHYTYGGYVYIWKEIIMYITLLIENKKRINICNYKHKNIKKEGN